MTDEQFDEAVASLEREALRAEQGPAGGVFQGGGWAGLGALLKNPPTYEEEFAKSLALQDAQDDEKEAE